MTIKFMYNGIKVDGTLYKGHYSKGTTYNADTITIYAKDYSVDFPKIEGLNIINESDSMTDYFEKDHIRVEPTNKFHKEVYQAWGKQELKRQQNRERRMNR
jgi:hypothetical protein